MFKEKKLNLIIFIALMGTSALALVTQMIFNNIYAQIFSYILEIGVIFIFLFYLMVFLNHLIKRKNFWENLKNPLKSNLYSAVPITAALISIMLIKIGIPYGSKFEISISIIFWLLSLFFSLLFIILVPINLKFRSAPEQVTGVWFLPPVGIFVLISAGSILALQFSSLAYTVFFLNLFLLGPAFVLYFLTLNLVYFRSKFHEPDQVKMVPTFNIVLAPVGVSILAMLTTSKLLVKYNFLGIGDLFLGISKIYSLLMFGYGLWILLGLFLLYFRSVKEKGCIPFSELWWAFIFPIGAFILASLNFYSVVNLLFIKIIYLILYFILLILWLYVFLREFLFYLRRKVKE